jgi:RNA polymerase sigma factor (sigma-70 family)
MAVTTWKLRRYAGMRWSRATDAELLAATGSDPEAFGEFYDRFETAVVGYLRRRTGDVELAVDLAGEVFATALQSAGRYRPQAEDGQSAAPWLFTIAQNKLTDARRRGQVESRARRRLGLREAVEYDDEALDRIESTVSQTGWVTQLLDRLPEDQREAVRARILDDRPYGEIAGELQTSELVVRKRVSRGLAALRKSLEETR